MGLRISRRPFLYSSHLIIEVLDKRKSKLMEDKNDNKALQTELITT